MCKLYSKNRFRLFAVVVSVLMSVRADAQYEPMFTQYMYNETFINPAYAGSHENISTTMLYRNQWVGMDGAPTTQTFSFHAPVSRRKLGLGLSLMNENIGVSHQLSVYGNIAYRILFDRSVLSFGLQGGFVNDEEKYTDVHTITPGDNQFATDARKLFLPNAGFGMYYYKDKFYAGLSIPRLLENKIELLQTGTVVKNINNLKYWHYYLTTGYVFDLNDDWKFKPSLMIKTVLNAPVEADVDATFILKKFLWLGAAYRSGDAVAAMIGFQITKQLRCGYSYDYTLTGLQKFNSGSHEFTLGYDFSFDKNKVISTRYF
jgi:type IX secretion system PorP/SprF family membrane protein